MTSTENWLRISLILCTFGFFREMRPSEPFVTEFLSGKWRNITAEQVNREIYPLGTYSYLAQLVVVFLITDILRYKPVIVYSACIGIVLWSLLLWTYTLVGLQIVQICYGSFMASEVAYYTYIYAKVDRSKYQQVTGHTRTAILSGRFIASVLAQILISFQFMDVRELNYISFGSQIISLILAISLPSVGISLYFYTVSDSEQNINIARSIKMSANDINGQFESNNHKENNEDNLDSSKKNLKIKFTPKKALQLIWYHFKSSYSNPVVFQWSLWWSLAMCGFLQVQSYVQILWHEIDSNQQQGYFNGGVEAALTLLSAISAFTAGFLDSGRYRRWDLPILTGCAVIEGGLLLLNAFTDNIWVAYVCYIAFGILYHFMITIANATVAKNIADDSFALIFGINTLIALALQSVFTVIVISENGFNLSPRDQFKAIGIYFILLAVIYAIVDFIYCIKRKCTER